jgi:hypothetical protein
MVMIGFGAENSNDEVLNTKWAAMLAIMQHFGDYFIFQFIKDTSQLFT